MADASMLRELGALGLSLEQVAGVIEVLERHDDERKAKNRERMRGVRERARTNVNTEAQPSTAEHVQVDGSPDKREIPQTPLEKTNPSPLATLGDSFSAREGDEFGREFSQTFWPAYPSKVGKPDALTAFIAARRGLKPKGKPPRESVTLERIMAGLERYMRSKPPDREWLHPATFLNGNRFDDEPASPPVSAKPKPHDTIFRALATVALQGDGGRERQADPDVRREADSGTAESDPDPFASIAIPAQFWRGPPDDSRRTG